MISAVKFNAHNTSFGRTKEENDKNLERAVGMAEKVLATGSPGTDYFLAALLVKSAQQSDKSRPIPGGGPV